MTKEFLFTSESVTEGHPDKVADQISDAVLDAALKDDPKSRVACETLVTTGLAILSGEITTKSIINYAQIARKVINEIGYTDSNYGIDGSTCGILTTIDTQSPDIAMGVDTGGAGDQGMMFGYATDETKELMPLPIMLAHKLSIRLSYVRKRKIIPYLRPDGKSQVTVRYVDDKPYEVTTVVISSQHDKKVNMKKLRKDIIDKVIKPIIPKRYIKSRLKILINPTGRFELGGPHADTGLTGRKIIVDTYGGFCSHGGGAFSGKDPSKVDRSAAYAARYIAKNIVAAKLAKRATVQIAYAIGVADPVSVLIDTHNTSTIPETKIADAVKKVFDLKPKSIIKNLNLLRPIYRKTAAYGHFGRQDKDFTWEKTDKIAALLKAVK